MKSHSEKPEHSAYRVVNIHSVGKEQEMVLKYITAVEQQQRAPVSRTSDCFRAQSQGSPHNPTGPLGGSSSSPELSFASLQGCFASGVSVSLAAQLWAVLQVHSSLVILVLTPPCVILTCAVTIPTPSLCSEPPCHPFLFASGALPQMEGVTPQVPLPGCPTPCGTSLRDVPAP